MKIWTDLTALAMLGTERPHEVPQADGALGEMLARIYPPSMEPARLPRDQALLDAAALVALYQRCGQQAPTVSHPAVTPCAAESQPALSAQGTFTLSVLLADPDKRPLLPAYLTWMAETGQRIPFTLLPDVLDAGRQERQLRPCIVAVIGERGVWLARQHADWSYAATADHLTQEWAVGDHTVRLAVLQRLRQTAPAQARTLLAETWRSERAAQRVAFLQVLQTGLSLADEAFLETCLEDRSTEVCQTAAGLLSALPEAQFSQRMVARVLPLVAYDRDSGTLSATLPEAFDPTWEREGLVAKPPAQPRRPTSERTWWVQQMLGLTPLAVWTQRWDVTPTVVLSSALQSMHQRLFLNAWAQASLWQRQADWAEAVLTLAPEPIPELWPLLPPARREAVWPTRLAQASTDAAYTTLLEQLRCLPAPWSAAFSLQVAQLLGTCLEQTPERLPYATHTLLSACALCMAPEVSAALAEVWAPHLQPNARGEKQVAKTLEMLRFRAQYMPPTSACLA